MLPTVFILHNFTFHSVFYSSVSECNWAKPERVGESSTEGFIAASAAEDGNHISASISSTGPECKHSHELEKTTEAFPTCRNLKMPRRVHHETSFLHESSDTNLILCSLLTWIPSRSLFNPWKLNEDLLFTVNIKLIFQNQMFSVAAGHILFANSFSRSNSNKTEKLLICPTFGFMLYRQQQRSR